MLDEKQNPLMIYIKYNPSNIRYYIINLLPYNIRINVCEKFISSNYSSFFIYVLNTICHIQWVSISNNISTYKHRLIKMKKPHHLYKIIYKYEFLECITKNNSMRYIIYIQFYLYIVSYMCIYN